MKEDFLHFLWRTRRFDLTDLTTTEGTPLEILHTGELNRNAGADFSNARVRIGETTWAGNVELHLKSSDWLVHQHQRDKTYDNVILHVVLEEDKPICRASGERIPCLEMKRRIPQKLCVLYQKLQQNEHWIPCQHHFYEAPELTKNLWLDRLLVERLEQKIAVLRGAWERNSRNWEETFYQFVARNFGMKINAEPFETLARSLPQSILAKHRDSLFQIEALLFGQAGMLEKDFQDEYPQRLKKEYAYLRKKYELTPIDVAVWKFLRLHPGNFPTLRIAQFSRLAQQSTHLFSRILEVERLEEMEQIFKLQLDGYWLTHYTFDKLSEERQKSFGKDAILLMTINTLVPFLFFYGSMRGQDHFKDRALRWLEELPGEKNTIISSWKKLGMHPFSAYRTQALLQLKSKYCDAKKCLNCAIGNAILR